MRGYDEITGGDCPHNYFTKNFKTFPFRKTRYYAVCLYCDHRGPTFELGGDAIIWARAASSWPKQINDPCLEALADPEPEVEPSTHEVSDSRDELTAILQRLS